jgi:hypothetical protein
MRSRVRGWFVYNLTARVIREKQREAPVAEILYGNELEAFVESKFKELAALQGLGDARCQVVEHCSGLRSWVHTGSKTYVWPAGGPLQDPIRDRRPSGLEAQVRERIAALQELISGATQ